MIPGAFYLLSLLRIGLNDVLKNWAVLEVAEFLVFCRDVFCNRDANLRYAFGEKPPLERQLLRIDNGVL